MTSKEFTLRWVLSALTCLALAVDAQVENPLGPEGLPAEPVELAARSPSSSPQLPADPVSEAPGRGVVIEAEIADESELARAKVRDAKADANVETALDRATKPKDLETAVRLQIFLDQKRFGPGFIDGKPGKFTTKAVHAYNRSVGRVPDDWSALLSELNGQLGELSLIHISEPTRPY